MDEQKEYLTLEEVAQLVGVKRNSLYYYIDQLDIQTHKFRLDRRTYIARADALRIKEIKEKPWLAGSAEEDTDAGDKAA